MLFAWDATSQTQLWSSLEKEGMLAILSKKLLWQICKTEDVAEPAVVHAGVPIVSASNQNASQALVWAIDANSTLFAWDATSLTQLWSSMDYKGDAPMCSNASFVKFATPTVLDDMVYIGCSDQLIGYGLKMPAAPEGQLSAFSGPSAEAPLPVGPTGPLGPPQPVQPSGPIGPTAPAGLIGR